MVQFLADVRPWAELAYFISAIVLAVAAVFALKQVSLLKSDIRLRSDRAAKEKAIEQDQRFGSVYLPLYDRLYDERKSKGFSAYGGPIGDFSFESLRSEDAKLAIKKFRDLELWRMAFNELEGIAAAFVTGVADAQVGFAIFGGTFCHSVSSSYDILACCRNDEIKVHLPYENVVTLYKIWAPRLRKAELAAQRDNISSQLQSIPDSKIPRLGDDEVGGD